MLLVKKTLYFYKILWPRESILSILRFMNYRFYVKRLFLISVIIVFISTSFVFNFSFDNEAQYWHLADSFLHGKLYFLEPVGTWQDGVYYKGHDYWHEGPFPAVVLMPVVIFRNFTNTIISQGAVNFIITSLVFLFLFKLARKYLFSQNDALILSFAFCFASVYQNIALIPWCWYFLHNVTVLLIVLSLYEYLNKKRYWLIGIIFACIFASRFTAGFGVIFFILTILTSKISYKQKIKETVYLLVPIVLCGVSLLFYNAVRFDNMFDNGFLRSNDHMLSNEQRFEQTHYGLFQLRNIPTNIYYYFIKVPDPVTLKRGSNYILIPPFIRVAFPGVNFFICSPVFLYCLRASFKKKQNKLLLVPIICILSVLMTYYYPGWPQVGPRYLLDLLPFVYLLLLSSFKGHKLTRAAIIIIFTSALLDFYLFYTVMNYSKL